MEQGNMIQYYRKKMGLSQEELGEKLFVSRQTVSQWENGQTTPSIDSLVRMRDIFGVSIEEILGITPPTEEATEQEAEPDGEIYSFKYSKKEYNGAYSYYKRTAIGTIILLCAVLLIINVLVLAGNTTSYDFLFSIDWFLCIVLFCVIFLLVRYAKEAKRINEKIEQTEYLLHISGEKITIKVTDVTNGEVKKIDSVSTKDIRSVVVTSTGHYLVDLLGRLYILRKADIPASSQLMDALKSCKKIKRERFVKFKSWTFISVLLCVLSIASLFVGLMISAYIAESNGNDINFGSYMWALFLFLPIPILSIVWSIISKKKKKHYKANLIIGIIMCVLLCIYGCFAFIFSDVNDPLSVMREEMQIDVPDSQSRQMVSGIGGTPDNISGRSRTQIIFSGANSDKLAAQLDERWLYEFSEELQEISPVDVSDMSERRGLIYNDDTNEYNAVPTEPGIYNMLLIIYHEPYDELLIYDYKLVVK